MIKINLKDRLRLPRVRILTRASFHCWPKSFVLKLSRYLENLESNDQDNQKDLIDEIKDLIKVIENSLNSEDIETITTNLQNLQQKLNLIVDSNTPVDTAVDS